MNLFLIILDIALLALGGFFVYWQGQIDVRASYNTFQIIFAAVFAVWFVTAGIYNMYYIIFIAACITLIIMAGSSGLTPTRLVATGVFQRVIPYSRLTGVTLTPLSLPNGRSMVVGIFALSKRRFVRLTFRTELDTLVHTLQPRLPASITITIQHVQ